MQSGLADFRVFAIAFSFESTLYPLGDFGVVVRMRGFDRCGGKVLAALGGFLVFFGNNVWLEQGSQPGMLEEHGVCRAEIGDFVQAAGGEVMCGGGEGVFWKVWWLAVDDGLGWKFD